MALQRSVGLEYLQSSEKKYCVSTRIPGAGLSSIAKPHLETALKTLDHWGEKADWEETVDKKAVTDYQALRKIIETSARRPIPWVPEVPYVTKEGRDADPDPVRLDEAADVRKRIREAISELHRSLKSLRQKELFIKYDEAFLIGLYTFVAAERRDQKLAGVNPENIPPEAKAIPELKSFLQKYLAKEGGLGQWQKNIPDAPVEGTALETMTGYVDSYGNIHYAGLCTEQSKVLYAVLRMAGINASFVEPRLTIDYYARKGQLADLPIPLPGHIASGVGVEVDGQLWVMDMALKMVRADYVADHSYWELSLRHYWMTDLSNLGVGQETMGSQKEAGESYETALQLGRDSTAYDVFFNYINFLAGVNPWSSPFCKNESNCISQMVSIHFYTPHIWDKIGWERHKSGHFEDSIGAFLNAINLDPRYYDAYEAIGSLLDSIALSNPKKLESVKNSLKSGIQRIFKNHPLFRKEIRGQLEGCAKRRERPDLARYFWELAGL